MAKCNQLTPRPFKWLMKLLELAGIVLELKLQNEFVVVVEIVCSIVLMMSAGCADCGEKIELVLDYIVERKRMDDLAGSIVDGRFREQKVVHALYLFHCSECNVGIKSEYKHMFSRRKLHYCCYCYYY